MYTQYEKKDISTVTLKNKLATSIMYSSIELTKTQVLLQNTALLVEGSLHFSLSLQTVRLLKLRANFRLWQKNLESYLVLQSSSIGYMNSHCVCSCYLFRLIAPIN